jgi:predicted Zn-dependent protease
LVGTKVLFQPLSFDDNVLNQDAMRVSGRVRSRAALRSANTGHVLRASNRQQTAVGEYGEALRTISNGNSEVARAAFNAAVRCYPDQRWLLLWRAYIVEKYEPKENNSEPCP